jgi:hypothetical protein
MMSDARGFDADDEPDIAACEVHDMQISATDAHIAAIDVARPRRRDLRPWAGPLEVLGGATGCNSAGALGEPKRGAPAGGLTGKDESDGSVDTGCSHRTFRSAHGEGPSDLRTCTWRC